MTPTLRFKFIDKNGLKWSPNSSITFRIGSSRTNSMTKKISLWTTPMTAAPSCSFWLRLRTKELLKSEIPRYSCSKMRSSRFRTINKSETSMPSLLHLKILSGIWRMSISETGKRKQGKLLMDKTLPVKFKTTSAMDQSTPKESTSIQGILSAFMNTAVKESISHFMRRFGSLFWSWTVNKSSRTLNTSSSSRTYKRYTNSLFVTSRWVKWSKSDNFPKTSSLINTHQFITLFRVSRFQLTWHLSVTLTFRLKKTTNFLEKYIATTLLTCMLFPPHLTGF